MGADNQVNNKRIAKNTIVLCLRMLFTMAVTLYTSRVVLSALGIVDYGIHNVVGGVVAMFSVLNSSMVTSTQRYLTFSLGGDDSDKLKRVFSLSLTIHFFIGIAVVFLVEVVGVWFLNNKLQIPEDRLGAANWVLQMSVIALFFNILQVPYNASVIAHEKMGVFACISVLEVILKLVIVLMLNFGGVDKLVLYSVLLACVSLVVLSIYRISCVRLFSECRYRYVSDKSLFREMMGFAGWNLFGSLAWMGRDQGVNIVLNLFQGPSINASRAVAVQVSNAVQNFANNFTTAINPQITKQYAQGNISEMEILAYRASKISYMLLLFISMPIILNIDFVLDVWLEEVPEYTSVFIVLILIDCLVHSIFGNPFITSLMATGNIRRYQIVLSTIILMIVPAGYLALYFGAQAPSVFVAMIVITVISGFARYWFCKIQINFRPDLFVRKSIVPILLTTATAVPVPLLFRHYCDIESELLCFVVLSLISVLCIGLSIYFVGLDKAERDSINKFIVNKVPIISNLSSKWGKE